MDPPEKTDTEGQFSSSLFDLWKSIKDEIYGFHEIFARKEQQQKPHSRSGKLKVSELPSSFQAEIENYWEFCQALPWTESWMIGLMAFHLLSLAFILLTRKCHNIQYIFFFLLLVAVYCSESINELAATHYKTFSKENYFDSQGLFLSTVFSGPVLLNCLVMISVRNIKTSNIKRNFKTAGNLDQKYFDCEKNTLQTLKCMWLWTTTRQLIDVKKHELASSKRKEEKKKDVENKKDK